MLDEGDCDFGTTKPPEAVWPTTTETPNEAPGCCRDTSYKANDKCRRNDNDKDKFVKQGCEFVQMCDFRSARKANWAMVMH